MTEISEQTVAAEEPKLLGPFLGHVTQHSIKIWLHYAGANDTIHVSLHPLEYTARAEQFSIFRLEPERLYTDCMTIGGLIPDTKYFYKLWTDAALSTPLDLQGLTEKDLHFRTLSVEIDEQIDFLMMS